MSISGQHFYFRRPLHWWPGICLCKGRANYAQFAQIIFIGHRSHFAKTHQRASKSVLGPYELYCTFCRKTHYKQKQCQKLFYWHTHAHFQNICDNPVTLLHNCHTVAQAQHCCTIVTVMFQQQCCKIVTLPSCSPFVLLFGPLLFHFCSQP